MKGNIIRYDTFAKNKLMMARKKNEGRVLFFFSCRYYLPPQILGGITMDLKEKSSPSSKQG